MGMKKLWILLCVCAFGAHAQTPQNPVIKSAGTINDIPFATVKGEPTMDYNIVIDIMLGASKPEQINPGLDNVARLLNLHAVAGVPTNKMHVVLAVHNESANALMNNDAYKNKFNVDNPNLKLLEELHNAGVKITVCGQSLVKRTIDYKSLAPNVEVAVSMLTTLTTYQLKGYAVLKF
jgi:intracellular sulfur oxidation DsrE/DsrF family protein